MAIVEKAINGQAKREGWYCKSKRSVAERIFSEVSGAIIFAIPVVNLLLVLALIFQYDNVLVKTKERMREERLKEGAEGE